ncbi:uncharacterized protein THITE_2119533 [Thermothielavioides terrestris NRRL 8126]|uniref:LysM domain-containing protein n=1 Tax=Thermothielavioides terrestris (strain ATCC 38088 / NRRL 8126) TaxID=578455 RepID=G2RBX6_THETT|nr:uncharacterized protein THITE_2119533 [Thermothielavioides terrestris NRRL 8126]AEO69297.1 hypothetical protein THITE_2119533 [Thermothielavioides terrestris NRRL 8126]
MSASRPPYLVPRLPPDFGWVNHNLIQSVQRNPRFLGYCPYCQTSGPAELPTAQRVRHRPREESRPDNDPPPPPYSAIAPSADRSTPPPPPPPYTPSSPLPSSLSPAPPPQPEEKEDLTLSASSSPPGYTIHHLRHPPHPTPDTIQSLSLRYGIPAAVLRRHNNLPPDADYLLFARHTLRIPTAYITNNNTAGHPRQPSDSSSSSSNSDSDSTSPSLSPHPVEDAAERARKTAIRRWMVACKEADYDVAVVYLGESGWALGEAVQRYWDDVAWEREHPLIPRSKYSGGGGRVGEKKGLERRQKGREARKGGAGGGALLGWWKS